MSTEKNIEDLFESEDLETNSQKPLTQGSSELAKIVLPSLESSDLSSSDVEKREFTRIDVQDRQISVRFHNEMHFAKHYIENISVGGVFVKTNIKYEMGEIVPIAFEIKTQDLESPELFQLKARVCRIVDGGIGLEFTNLDQVSRSRLESYVQSILPSGMSIRTKAKASTVERLENMRHEKLTNRVRQKRILVQLLAVIVLAALNALLVQQHFESDTKTTSSRDEYFEINGKRLKWSEIRSLEHRGANQIELKTDEESILLNETELKRLAPDHIRLQIMILKSTPARKEVRRSKNAQQLIQVREFQSRTQ